MNTMRKALIAGDWVSSADGATHLAMDNHYLPRPFLMIEKIFIEPGLEDNCESDPFEVSDADTMLAWLLSKDAPSQKPDRKIFVG